MNLILAVFTSRTHTLLYSRLLKQIGITNSVVTTPRAILKACGISVQFYYNNLSRASMIINQYKLNSFKNFYLIDKKNNQVIYIPL